jgi:hypothetical protein
VNSSCVKIGHTSEYSALLTEMYQKLPGYHFGIQANENNSLQTGNNIVMSDCNELSDYPIKKVLKKKIIFRYMPASGF